jgi:hypothetical protein
VRVCDASRRDNLEVKLILIKVAGWLAGWLRVHFVTVTSVLLPLGEQVWAQITSTQLSEMARPYDGRGDKAPFRIQWTITCLFH